MAVIQTTDQIRYLRRKNLEEEARIMGNYYSDIVSQYGIDCIYHKMDMSNFSDFKTVIDQNAILRRAYGYEITPQYHISVDTVAFAEVDSDIFNLNKIGYTPNADITLVFDRIRFACDLAPVIGRYKEYSIEEREVAVEVPEFNPDDQDIWPMEIDLGDASTFTCGVMSGQMRCVLSGYEIGKKQTVVCDPYENARFKVCFPKNEDLYYSLKHSIESDDYLEAMLFLTFTVDKVAAGNGTYRYLLRGKTHGSVLFFDLDQLGKYAELTHPSVGDIVEIDFPDENNREKYEITDCFDKQLTQDGINPLLHKYVWKCKARRYINSYEDGAPAPNEADERLDERRKYEDVVQEQVAEKISFYDDIDKEKGIQEDSVYGGYDGVVDKYDKQDPSSPSADGPRPRRYEMIEGMEMLDIMRFRAGSRLVTDGYELVFLPKPVPGAMPDAFIVAPYDKQLPSGATFDSGLKWLKATDSQIVFVNIEGQSTVLASDRRVNGGEIEISIDDMAESTLDAAGNGRLNPPGSSFIKFSGTRTLMFATEDHLYAKLKCDGQTYQLI